MEQRRSDRDPFRNSRLPTSFLDNPITNVNAARKQALEKINQLFAARALFVPLSVKQLTRAPSLADMADGEYQARLLRNGIAIVCGPENHHLCGINFPNYKKLWAMWNANPWLSVALVTEINWAPTVWLVVNGEYPPDVAQLATCNWIGSGLMPLVDWKLRPECCTYRRGAAVSCKFSDIVWPAEDREKWLEYETRIRLGPVFVEGKLNHRCVALTFAERLNFHYDPLQKIFWKDAEAGITIYTQADALHFVARLINKTSSFAPIAARIDYNAVLSIIMKERVSLLSSVTAMLRTFLLGRISRQRNGDVTITELSIAFEIYYFKRYSRKPPHAEVRRAMRTAILELFGLTESKSVRRQNGDQNGFRGITLKAEAEGEASITSASN